MKVNFLRKAKWYIVGFILVAIMLSVSLSFSAWDMLSAKAKLENSGSGGYKDVYKLVEDANGNRLADVGDVVEFGNYYQDANDTVKSPLKWIVADKVFNNATSQYELSVITQSIVAHGSFFGGTYAKSDKWDNLFHINPEKYRGSQNYSQSTVRAWLNLDGTDKYVRTDYSTPLSIDSTDGVAFKGFYNQAFSENEKRNIIPKTISGVRGGKIFYANIVDDLSKENYATVTDKVWIPSYSEVFGVGFDWQDCSDGMPNKQFEFFKSKLSRIAKTTDFASSNLSNYTVAGIEPTWTGNWNDTQGGDAGLWMLRSPNPIGIRLTNFINALGDSVVNHYWTVDSLFGIRPAIILPY